MGLMGRWFGKETGRLAWAPFFTRLQYEAFTDLVERSLLAHSGSPDFDDGTARLPIGGKRQSIGLRDLARKCHVANPEAWRGLIAEHLERALSQRGQSIAGELGESFDKAALYLKAQIVPDRFVRRDWTEGESFKTLGGNANVALVYDLPETVDSVPASDVRAWGRPLPELLEVATANVRKEPALKPERLDLHEGSVYLLEGKSFFVCTHALWLQEYPEAASPGGALFTVPARNVVQFHAIRDATAEAALQVLSLTAKKLHAQLPFPISTHVFWSRDGRVGPVPLAVVQQAVPFGPWAQGIGR